MKKIALLLFIFFLNINRLWAEFGVTPTQLYITNKQQRSTTVTLSLSEGSEKKYLKHLQ